MKKLPLCLISIFIFVAMSCDWQIIHTNRPSANRPDDKDKNKDKDKDKDEEEEEVPGPKKPKIDVSLLDQQCKEVVQTKPSKKPFIFSELEERFLTTHNAVRKIYGLKDLIWDDNLASYAQEWAEYLKKNNQCLMKHRSHVKMTAGKSYGENLAWNWTSLPTPPGVFVFTPEKANHGWSSECAFYDYNTNSCKQGEQCGHFTQVLWATTKKVGCGVATCDGSETNFGYGRSEIWVCNYFPPGNWVGLRPF